MEKNQKFTGRLLRRFRKEAGYTLAQAAEKLGVSPPFLSMVENGRSGISFKNVHKLLELYDKTMADLAPIKVVSKQVVNIRDGTPLPDIEKGIAAFSLAGRGSFPGAESYRLDFEPGRGNLFDSHRGVEYVVVLSGDFSLTLADDPPRVFEVKPGDTITYPGTTAHQWMNRGNTRGSLLIIRFYY